MKRLVGDVLRVRQHLLVGGILRTRMSCENWVVHVHADLAPQLGMARAKRVDVVERRLGIAGAPITVTLEPLDLEEVLMQYALVSQRL